MTTIRTKRTKVHLDLVETAKKMKIYSNDNGNVDCTTR